MEFVKVRYLEELKDRGWQAGWADPPEGWKSDNPRQGQGAGRQRHGSAAAVL